MKKTIDYLIWGLMPWNIILAIIGIVILGAFITRQIAGYECAVLETGYYHSTNKEDKCSFIESAKRSNYTIKRTSQNEAIKNGYKICHECFSKDEQESYNRLMTFHSHLDNYSQWLKEHMHEDLGWTALAYRHNYDSLFVYIDSNSILHISAFCGNLADNGNARKVRFEDVNQINSTCGNCVERKYVDFIYKKINTGVYDTSQIKDVDVDF